MEQAEKQNDGMRLEQINDEEKAFVKFSAQLMNRLENNLNAYYESLNKMDKTDLIHNAQSISAMNYTYEYLTENYQYSLDEIQFLLKFENPLQEIRDAVEVDHTVLLNSFAAVLINKDEEEVVLDSDKDKISEIPRNPNPEIKSTAISGYKVNDSVLDNIRNAAKMQTEALQEKPKKEHKKQEMER